ncbi:hypothetical protein [Microvirga sp. CF3016]|uniref:hypothetical protein n=1 Tax=Microvirga sp. CF3016 TaxID=3110181 RepID=UPI002E797C5E|nr:hypothetical protein [Microvirga sp. CF3016]MEE1609958.1 hypothetical protein [Microvirga sp. CF3016]
MTFAPQDRFSRRTMAELGLFQGTNGADRGKRDGREVLPSPYREIYPASSSEASVLHGAAKIDRSRTRRYATLAMMDA